MTEPQLLDVLSVARRLSVGRTTVFKLIRTGKLESVKIANRRLVTEAQLARFITSLENRGQA